MLCSSEKYGNSDLVNKFSEKLVFNRHWNCLVLFTFVSKLCWKRNCKMMFIPFCGARCFKSLGLVCVCSVNIWLTTVCCCNNKEPHSGPRRKLNQFHDDVIKWKHFPRYWPFVRGSHRSPVNSPHKGQWRGALMFTLICARINGWVNNREAGDLRCHRAHYDVIVMLLLNNQYHPHNCERNQVIEWSMQYAVSE